MARKRQPRKIGSHTEENMRAAIDLIASGEKIRKAAKLKELPYATLRRYYLKTTNARQGQKVRLVPNYNINQIFSSEQEEALKKYLKNCAYLFYGLTNKDYRKLAYETANINKIRIPESWKKNKMAGLEWLRSFRVRHPDLSLRAPESCSLARATGFNRHNIEKYFQNLEDVLKRHPNFANGTRVYNLDETATTTVQKPPKVLAPKGIRCLSKVTSGEKGTLCTTCAIVCAGGYSLPPAIIFPRKNFKNYMIKGAPPGTLGLAAPSGWMNSEVFPEVMKHFIKCSSSSMDNPSLLIFDNHESHLSLESLKLAKSHGVTILTLPPHSSHKTQPLDVGLFKPFKTFYNASMDSWMMRNPGQPVTIYDVGAFIGEAYMKTMTPTSIVSSFRATGIVPFDRTIFTEIDFLPSTVTDRPQVEELGLTTVAANNDVSIDLEPDSEKENNAPQKNLSMNEYSLDFTEKENKAAQENSSINDSSQTSHKKFIDPTEFRPPIKAKPRKNVRKNRKKGRSMIPTDTPEKEQIELEKQARKRQADMKTKVGCANKKGKTVVRRVLQDSSTSESDTSMILESDGAMTDEFDDNSDIDSIPIAKDQLGNLSRDPVEGEFVLVEFQGRKDKIYYLAKVLAAQEGEFDVSFLRKKSPTQYVFCIPDIPDLSTVPKSDIKLILPKPSDLGSTSRCKNSFYSFNIDFCGLDLR